MNFSTKQAHLSKEMKIARVAESSTLREQPNEPSEPKNDEGEINAVYNLKESRKSQMRIQKEVKRNEEE